jgi:hypothetical protein
MVASDVTDPNDADAQICHPLGAVNARTFRGQTANELHESHKKAL